MENKKIIKSILDKNDDGKIVIKLIFEENNEKTINFEDESSTQIENVFLELAKNLVTSSITIEDIKVTEKIDQSKDNLFIEVAKEYIKDLNLEIGSIEKGDILKKIREENI